MVPILNPSNIHILYSFFHEKQEPCLPHALNQGQPCDLLRPVDYSRSDLVPVSGWSSRGLMHFPAPSEPFRALRVNPKLACWEVSNLVRRTEVILDKPSPNVPEIAQPGSTEPPARCTHQPNQDQIHCAPDPYIGEQLSI